MTKLTLVHGSTGHPAALGVADELAERCLAGDRVLITTTESPSPADDVATALENGDPVVLAGEHLLADDVANVRLALSPVLAHLDVRTHLIAAVGLARRQVPEAQARVARTLAGTLAEQFPAARVTGVVMACWPRRSDVDLHVVARDAWDWLAVPSGDGRAVSPVAVWDDDWFRRVRAALADGSAVVRGRVSQHDLQILLRSQNAEATHYVERGGDVRMPSRGMTRRVHTVYDLRR